MQQFTSGIAHIDTIHEIDCYVTCRSNTKCIVKFCYIYSIIVRTSNVIHFLNLNLKCLLSLELL